MRKNVFTTKHLTTIDNRNTTDKKLLLSDKKCQVANFEFPLEKKRGKPADSPLEFVILYCKPKKYKLMGKGITTSGLPVFGEVVGKFNIEVQVLHFLNRAIQKSS